MPTAVALIPARAGSVRVPGKNVRPLAGHPLIAYSIAAAHESGVFDAVVVSTDSEDIARIARHYGAGVPGLRPAEMAASTSPDIEWVRHALRGLAADGREFELFSILRPTSPFRTGATIQRALDRLLAAEGAESVRAVRRCKEHPGKMWVLEGELLRPVLESPPGEVPLHSRQFAALPEVYVQDSSLEIAWTEIALRDGGDIAGDPIVSLVSQGVEGFSIDYPEEFAEAEAMIADGRAFLPPIAQDPVAVA